MILADSSVWVDHWKVANLGFARLLVDRQVLMHPLVLGELAVGSLKNRQKTLTDLKKILHLQPASHEDVLEFIETKRLFSRGIGYIDMHLLAAAFANSPVKILTRDRRFRQAAEELGIAA